MLITKAQVRPGEWVLIWGVGGGVASSALEICRAAGARAIVTSSSDAKLQRARSRSAQHATVNHARDDVADAVRSLTDGRGVDVVVEHVGAATWARSIDALTRGGRLVICGASSGGQPPAGLHRIFWKQVSVHGSTMGSDSEFRAVLELGAAGRIRPHVDAVFPLERVARGAPRGSRRASSSARSCCGSRRDRRCTLIADGAVSGNPGPGGWSAILISGEHRASSRVACPTRRTTAWS